MLNKRGKVILDLHKEHLYLERRINTEVSKLEKRAKSDFKRMLRQENNKAKVIFASLKENIFSKEWKPQIQVDMIYGFDSPDLFERFCLKASAAIGIEFTPMKFRD